MCIVCALRVCVHTSLLTFVLVFRKKCQAAHWKMRDGHKHHCEPRKPHEDDTTLAAGNV